MLTTTLKEIYERSTHSHKLEKLLKRLGKTYAEAKCDETPLPITTVLDINGIEYALWVLDNCTSGYICRLVKADCADRVLHIFESECPDDTRPRDSIATLRNPNATDKELAKSIGAASDAALSAQLPAARSSGWAAASNTWAARDAASASARFAERKAQVSRLRQYLTHGEAAKDMPWD